MFTALAAVAVGAQGALLAYASPPPAPGARSIALGALVRALALPQPSLAADWLYLGAVAQFGQRSTRPDDYATLAAQLRQCCDIDGQFGAPYILAGTALHLQGMDTRAGRELLVRGARSLPRDWHIQFLLGAQTYLTNPGDHGAAVALLEAAKLPGAPPYLAHLAVRVAAQAQDPELGLDLLEALSAQTDDPQLRSSYASRQRLLLLERVVVRVQAAVDAYRRRHGQPPPQLGTLVEAGLLAAVPEDPVGGALGLTAAGAVTTTHESQRLSRIDGAQAVPAGDGP